MKPKLVITDLDETLVVKHQYISDRAKNAILKLREHGVYFGIASGRPLFQITPLTNAWGIECDVVLAYNGCHLHDFVRNTLTEKHIMKAEWIQETIDLLRDYPVALNITVGELNYYNQDMHWDEETKKNYPVVIEPDEKFYVRDIPKIMMRLWDEKDMPAIEEQVKSHPNPNWKGFKTGSTVMEFANIHVSKGTALREFCENNQIDIADVVALGDTTNDNDLLIEAGTGVCMANGSDDTKAIANVITDLTCEEDGWADYIEKTILIPNGWM